MPLDLHQDAGPDPIDAVTLALRRCVLPVIGALAGDPPRPSRLVRLAGLDKSMASRLAQAARAGSDAEFLHRLPSPAGLRMLLERARAAGVAEPALADAAAAVERFQRLIDTLPGGRQALDARIGTHSDSVRQRRENMARQAVFKAQSFLFGHYCDTLTTSLFVLPSATPGRLDVLEVHRRLGLHPVRPGSAVPVLSVMTAGAPADPAAPRLVTLAGDAPGERMADYLLADFSSQPPPPLRLERDGELTLFILDGEDRPGPPLRLSTALRVLRAAPDLPTGPFLSLRDYMLHLPCARLVRQVFLAPGLWPQVRPRLRFLLPNPPGAPAAAPTPGQARHRDLPLSASWQPAAEPDPLALDGVPDQADALRHALQRAGAPLAGWRGWHCDMAYPQPLVDMQIGFEWPAPGA